MIWDWLREKYVACRSKWKFILAALSVFGAVFMAGIQSTRLSAVREFFRLPATLDYALIQMSQIDAELSTLSEVRSVLDDIPADLTKAKLIERMNTDSDYQKRLTSRLVRLLGYGTKG
jgi:hypothetical protein